MSIPVYRVNGAIWKPGYSFFNVYCDGELVRKTYAKTKAQAINNVRHNYIGDVTDWYEYDWCAVKTES